MSFIEKIFGSHSEREVKKLKFAIKSCNGSPQ